MKSFRKMLLLLLVLLLIPMMAACGDDDDDKEDRDSGSFTIPKGKNSAEGIVEAFVKASEMLEDAQDEMASTFLMFKNKKALKKLDIDTSDEDDFDYSWKITKSKNYDEDSAVTAGVKEYVRMQMGDKDAIEETALVELTVTYKTGGNDDDDDDDDDNMTHKLYMCAAKIGGNWYLVSENTQRANNINEAAEYWEKRKSPKEYEDYD